MRAMTIIIKSNSPNLNVSYHHDENYEEYEKDGNYNDSNYGSVDIDALAMIISSPHILLNIILIFKYLLSYREKNSL